jgi:CheY-like chemotaxis protein
LFGYKVLTAGTGFEALAVSDQYPDAIHVLLTDIAMPQMSGRALAENLTMRRRDIRVLYLSGDSLDVIIRQGLLEPGVRFLQKPYSAGALARMLRQMLD